MTDRDISIAVSAMIAIGVTLVLFLFLHLGGLSFLGALLTALIIGLVLMALLLFAAWGRDGMPPELRDRYDRARQSWGPMRERMNEGMGRMGQSVGPMAGRMGERVSPLREKIGEIVGRGRGTTTDNGVTREDRAVGIHSAGVMTRPAAAGPGGVAPGGVVPEAGAESDTAPDAMRQETQEQARREWSGGEAAMTPEPAPQGDGVRRSTRCRSLRRRTPRRIGPGTRRRSGSRAARRRCPACRPRAASR